MFEKNGNNRGAVIVMFLVLLSVMMLMVAFSLDVGYVYATKAELQHAADAAALASIWELFEESPDFVGRIQEYAGYNRAADASTLNVLPEDVKVGYMQNPFDIQGEVDVESAEISNSIEVTIRRSQNVNGPLGLFLGAFTGLDEIQLHATARAVVTDRIIGFDSPPFPMNDSYPSSGQIMPFAIKNSLWDAITNSGEFLNDNGQMYIMVEGERIDINDDYSYEEMGHVLSFSDEIFECIMYTSDPGATGNYGTVDFGDPNNSAADLARQIEYGVNQDDLLYFGEDGFILDDGYIDGENEEDPFGYLNGDTGISWSIKDELQSQAGIPRIVALYEDVIDPHGNNTQFRITGFAAVVICDVIKKDKAVVIQPFGDQTGAGLIDVNGAGVIGFDAPHSSSLWVFGLSR
ncbi:MAG: hypothetical protein JXR73_02215 [Candidatus Omnitrophica bacterium]|nr:hypothetical protein [Candidatus Omnitrophota bacterium]